MKRWISAIRPRTLPLAISGILMGTFPAMLDNSFRLPVLILAMSTALLLQTLSNLANDYGDFIKGTDVLSGRSDRALASGEISPRSMRNALIITIILTLVTGIGLLVTAFDKLGTSFLILLFTGLLSIGAAIKYTVGKKPYGYHGLGDLAVLVFFGYIAVCGSYYLYCTNWDSVWTNAFLPATGLGLLCAGVLNINNIRDINTDRMNGKHTLAVLLGRKGAMIYQSLLILTAFVAFYLQWASSNKHYWIFLMAFPLYAVHTYRLAKLAQTDMQSHHRMLKLFVLLTLAFVCLYGIAILS